MTWVIPVAIGAAQIQQQGAIGKTNQAIQNRNAQVFKQEGDAIEQQAEFDVAAFAKQFKKLQAEQKVATIKSGAELSGTYFKILKSNEREKFYKTILLDTMLVLEKLKHTKEQTLLQSLVKLLNNNQGLLKYKLHLK
jgi:hypothetical protein